MTSADAAPTPRLGICAVDGTIPHEQMDVCLNWRPVASAPPAPSDAAIDAAEAGADVRALSESAAASFFAFESLLACPTCGNARDATDVAAAPTINSTSTDSSLRDADAALLDEVESKMELADQMGIGRGSISTAHLRRLVALAHRASVPEATTR